MTAGGGFKVLGWNDYLEEGSYTFKVQISDEGGSKTVASGTATVVDVDFKAVPIPTELLQPNVEYTLPLASFSEGAADLTSEFTATIDWNDGSSAGTIRPAAYVPGWYWNYDYPPQFTVIGTHTYTTTGTKKVTVTITDVDGATQTMTEDVTVKEAIDGEPTIDPYLSVNVKAVSGLEGSSVSGGPDEIIATFTDGMPGDPRIYTPVVHWGDGAVDPFLPLPPGVYSVKDNHVYQEEGNYKVEVRIYTTLNVFYTTYGSGTNSATIAEAPVIPGTLQGSADPLFVNEQTVLDTALATFSYSDSSATKDDFKASIIWGDSTAPDDSGVVDGGDGLFKVEGTHTYKEAGNYPLTVTLTHPSDGNSVVAFTSVTVNDPPLAATDNPDTLDATVGTPLTDALLAKFTDPNKLDSASAYTATVSWGDGTSPTTQDVNVTGSEGNFTVTGKHTYNIPGAFTATVIIADGNANKVQATVNIDVMPASPPPPPLTGNAYRITAKEGTPLTHVKIASFTDVNLAHPVACHDVKINWGDNSTSSDGTVEPTGDDGSADVFGDHTYREQGNYLVTVTISHNPGLSINVYSTAIVSDPAIAANGAALTTTAVGWWYGYEGGWWNWWSNSWWYHYGYGWYGNPWWWGGSWWTGNVQGLQDATVATFTDPHKTTSPSDYTVTIDWGDGSTGSGKVVGSHGEFRVLGSHTYWTQGKYNVVVTIEDNGVNVAVVNSNANVALASAGTPAFVPTANFQNTNPWDQMARSTIGWGDGSNTIANAGTGFGSWWEYYNPNWDPSWYWWDYWYWWPSQYWYYWGGTQFEFSVSGDHIYSKEGTYTAHSSVMDDPPDIAATDNRQVTVADAPLAAVGTRTYVVGNEGEALGNLALAIFNDVDPNGTSDKLHAVIDWGDGSTPTTDGEVKKNDDGTFTVSADHTYSEEGTYSLVITLEDDGGSNTTATATAKIYDWNLSAQPESIGALAGIPTGTVTVATFTDADGEADEFMTKIEWGDSSTTDGTVKSTETPGKFAVQGNHTYAAKGDYKIRVTIMADPLTVKVTSYANVIDWTLANPLNRTNDPERAMLLPFGEAAVALNTGGLRLSHALDFDWSPGTSVGGDPALVYNSDTVSVRPIAETSLVTTTSPGVPSQIDAQMTWDEGDPEPWVTWSKGNLPGDSYLLAVQHDEIEAQTRLHHWQVQFRFHVNGTEYYAVSSGTAQVVNNDQSPFGPGWGIAGVDRLAFGCGGLLWVTGTGDSRYFKENANGVYTSPSEDFGTLEQDQKDYTFTYTAKDQTKYKFNKKGLLTAVVDTHQLARTYEYDDQNRLFEVDTPDGGVTSLSYSGPTFAAIIEPGGRIVLGGTNGFELTSITDVDNIGYENTQRFFGYDSYHHLTIDVWTPLQAVFTYDPLNGRLKAVNRSLGNTYAITPEAVVGLPTLPPGDPTPPILLKDALGSVTDARQNTTSYLLDVRGRSLFLRTADLATQTWTRDVSGQVTLYVDQRKYQTTYAYQNGDLTEVDYPDPSSVHYAYDPTFHHVTQFFDGLGNPTYYTYDAVTGDKLTMTDASGGVTTYVWDQGLLQTVTDPRNIVTSYHYDAHRRVDKITQAVGTLDERFSQMGYDKNGNLLWQTTGESSPQVPLYAHPETTSYTYDDRNRLRAKTEALTTDDVRTTSTDYDAVGNVTKVVDPLSHVTSYAYDSVGRLIQTDEIGILAESRTAKLYYDVANNLLSKTTGIAPTNPT